MKNEVYQKYKKAGGIAREAREHAIGLVKEGASVLELVEEAENLIRRRGAEPAFPINVAIDSVAAHFTPRTDDRIKLERGSIVKIDVGVHVDGYIGDTAETSEVGTRNWSRLIDASQVALDIAIELIKPDAPIRMIGGAIERSIGRSGFKPISNLTGHNLRRFSLHSGKSIPNIMDDTKDHVLLGEALAIEPFATNGAGKVDGGKRGNIYRFVKKGDAKKPRANELLGHIEKKFNTLPFAERWCTRFERKAPAYLQRLVRRRLVYAYPILSDIGKGRVSQAEHTVIVTKDGCDVTT
ncbi:MAG: type II methionyl aminopeptidase [Methanomassiliicoccales archaeon]|nr:MAG: type II methionyl aminopeptidase [Methanomassiliicoccales archaeon]